MFNPLKNDLISSSVAENGKPLNLTIPTPSVNKLSYVCEKSYVYSLFSGN